MTTKPPPPPAPRKPAGLLSRMFSGVLGLLFWLVMSLLLSIIIEWIGMTWFWPEQGADHARSMLMTEKQYLNNRLVSDTHLLTQWIGTNSSEAISWVKDQLTALLEVESFFSSDVAAIEGSFTKIGGVSLYLSVIPDVVQLFLTRLTILIFSLPVFILFLLVGLIDGLVERHLRRWGGGRESSHTYNLARKSIFPLFITASVVYLSLPFSIHPAFIIMPFAVFVGIGTRITFERLKKYF